MAHLIRLSICKESVRHQFSVGVLPAHYAGERDCRADTRVIDCHQPCGLHSRKDIVHLLPSKIPFLCETNFRELRLTWFRLSGLRKVPSYPGEVRISFSSPLNIAMLLIALPLLSVVVSDSHSTASAVSQMFTDEKGYMFCCSMFLVFL